MGFGLTRRSKCALSTDFRYLDLMIRSSPAIQIENVVKRYGKHTAVNQLNLTVPAGTVYGVLGPNGAGKTTTIRMVMNILAPDSGRIEVLGLPGSARRLADQIGYLPEERGLYRRMTVRDVLRFLGRLKGVSEELISRRIDQWLERFDLRTRGIDWGDARVDQLSRGMQQKVQFIGALLHEPSLVILDEPFSGLDPVNAQALKDTVLEIRSQGRTVLFSTHVIDNAERMCDAVCIIANGDKLLDGEVHALRQQSAARMVILEFATIPDETVRRVLADTALVARLIDMDRVIEVELQPAVEHTRLLRQLGEVNAPLVRFERVLPSLHRLFLERVGAFTVEDRMQGHG